MSGLLNELRQEWRSRSWPGRVIGVVNLFSFAAFVLFWGGVGLLAKYVYMFRGTPPEEQKDVFWPIRAAVSQVRGDKH
jgi:hypothetical protein